MPLFNSCGPSPGAPPQFTELNAESLHEGQAERAEGAAASFSRFIALLLQARPVLGQGQAYHCDPRRLRRALRLPRPRRIATATAAVTTTTTATSPAPPRGRRWQRLIVVGRAFVHHRGHDSMVEVVDEVPQGGILLRHRRR